MGSDVPRWDCVPWKGREEFYDAEGNKTAEFVMEAGGECPGIQVPMGQCGPVFALNIPAGQWHTLRALESGTVILEMKDGAYEPIGAEDVMER